MVFLVEIKFNEKNIAMYIQKSFKIKKDRKIPSKNPHIQQKYLTKLKISNFSIFLI